MKKHKQLYFIDPTLQKLIPPNDPLKILFDSIDFSFKKVKRWIPKGKRVKEVLADATYDTTENLSFLQKENITPYIPENKRSRKNPIVRGNVFITEKGEIICKAGKKLLR